MALELLFQLRCAMRLPIEILDCFHDVSRLNVHGSLSEVRIVAAANKIYDPHLSLSILRQDDIHFS